MKTKLFVLLIAFALATPTLAEACPTRDEISGLIQQGLSYEDILAMYPGCAPADTASILKAQSTVTPPGSSVVWEAIDSCGYHPQRQELDCSVEVRQRFGFGGFPGFGPGSNEWILFCVDFGGGLVPINISNVHLHDEMFGVLPNWYYGISVPANQQLQATPLLGQTLNARAILSWFFPVFTCNAAPTWGNWANFQIKLDP